MILQGRKGLEWRPRGELELEDLLLIGVVGYPVKR